MKKIIGIRFKKTGKIYFFDPAEFNLKLGDSVIVETTMGKEIGKVVAVNRQIDEKKLKEPLRKILKVADKDDLKHQEENAKKEKEAFETCKKKIKEHKLDMELVEARYLFDNSKLIFYFISEGRIDFRDLVKDLASIYRTRIELRQIGVRDQIKRLGGNGICGRELCCCSFLNNFDTVSIKMAKEQNLSLNAAKVTGNCGATVKTEEGEGIVDGVEVLREILKVKFKDEEGNNYFKKFNASDVEVIKDSRRTIKEDEEVDPEELKELEKIEEMDKIDKKNTEDDEI